MEEIIHWCCRPFPLKAPISLPSQNKVPKLVPLWVIHVFLTDGTSVVDVPLHAPLNVANDRSKFWYHPTYLIFPAL